MSPSAKQKRWRRIFAQRYGGKKKRRSTTRRRRKRYSVAARPRRRYSMARRRYGRKRRRRGGFGGVKSMVGRVAKGIGYASLFGPQLGAAAAYVTGGGIVGAGIAYFAPQVQGTINSVLGGVLGGGAGSSGNMNW